MFFKFVLIKRHSMNKESNFVLKYCLRAKDTTKETGDAYSNVVFLFPVAQVLQGVQHSSSLPDYIEDKKSGGQQTDCLNKSLCNDQTIIIGREARKRQMLKTVIKSQLIGTL
jgi:hypothetical protein